MAISYAAYIAFKLLEHNGVDDSLPLVGRSAGLSDVGVPPYVPLIECD